MCPDSLMRLALYKLLTYLRVTFNESLALIKSDSAAVTMFGREFLVVGTVQQKAHAEKLVLCNGTNHSRSVEELFC